MALIKCPDCGKEFSDQAPACPNCGRPNQTLGGTHYSQPQPNTNRPPVPPYQNGRPNVTVSPSQPYKKNSGLSIVALVFSILGCTFIVGVILAIIDLCKKDATQKHTLSKIALCISAIWLIISIVASSGSGDDKQKEVLSTTEETVTETVLEPSKEPESLTESTANEKAEEKSNYNVGDMWENKNLRITYTGCGEYTDYDSYDAPAEGNKIIYATFDIENIGDSDKSVMYTDFDGYADGYEVSQSYAPEGTGLDFTVSLSSGRKGSGIVAFEVPQNADTIEIEYSPNILTSEKVVFIYSE